MKAVISLHTPDRNRRLSPACPKKHERSSATDLTLTPEPTTDIEPEPTSAMEQSNAPPSMENEPDNVSVQELELEATS